MITLAQWLRDNRMTAVEFGRRVGLKRPENANRWAMPSGSASFRRPEHRFMAKIIEITAGNVNGASFDPSPLNAAPQDGEKAA